MPSPGKNLGRREVRDSFLYCSVYPIHGDVAGVAEVWWEYFLVALTYIHSKALGQLGCK